jgi:hypothetical protein
MSETHNSLITVIGIDIGNDAAAAEDAARRLCEMPYLDLDSRTDQKLDRCIPDTEASRPM